MHCSGILVIIPTYNERRNIGMLVDNLFRVNPGLSLLVIDDNSPDGTCQEVKKKQGEYKNIHLIVRDKKRGLGSAYIEGFNYALRNGYQVIIQMDADLSHSSDCIPDMIDLLDRCDMVIGSRYIKGGGVYNWGCVRIVLSKLANFYARLLLHNIPIKDLTSGFKCIKSSALSKINFSAITAKGYAFQIEMVYRIILRELKVTEYPIVFVGRKYDKSKMSLGIILEAVLRITMLSLHSAVWGKRDFGFFSR